MTMKIDHWWWCVAGLRGVVQMLTKLLEGKVPSSRRAIDELNEHIASLQEIAKAAESSMDSACTEE